MADGPLRTVTGAEVACVRVFDVDLRLRELLEHLPLCEHHREVLSAVEGVACALCLEGRLSLKGEEEEEEGLWRKAVGRWVLLTAVLRWTFCNSFTHCHHVP